MPVSQALPDGPFTPGAGTPGPDVAEIVAFLKQKGNATDAEVQAALDLKPDSADFDTIVQRTQAQYDAITTKDARTLYVIVG